MWKGAVILTIAALFLKVLSAIYRIPYQNLVGDVGYYIYQQIYPFFGVGITLATYGFPVVIAKLIADKREEGKIDEIRDIVKVSFYSLSFIGVIIFACLFLGAHEIAAVMGDLQLASLIQVIAFYFLLMPIIAVLRGYFQGQFNMMPTAISQVAEQIVRVGVILCASYFLLQAGFNVYEIGGGAISGSIFGAVAAIIVLLFCIQKEGVSLRWRRAYTSQRRLIMKYILVQGITICICNLVLVFIQLVDAINFYSLLVEGGITEGIAKEAKGVYDRSLPLIQLGTVVATSIALALVPQLRAGSKEEKEGKMILALKFCFIFAIGATIGLVCIAEPTNIMLYKNNKGTIVLGLLALCILFGSLAIATAAILQGINEMVRPALHVIIGVVVKWIGNILLMPFFHMYGAAIATIVSLFVVIVLNMKYLSILTTISWKKIHGIMQAVWAGGFMAIFLVVYGFLYEKYIIAFENIRLNATIHSLSAVILGGTLYLILLLKFRAVEVTEVSMFTKNKKVQQFVSRISGR
jgi:polysaccharide transporter, PST family